MDGEVPRRRRDRDGLRRSRHGDGLAGRAALILVAGADPIEDYLAALRLLEGVTGGVDVVVPGSGSIGGGDQVRVQIDQDRAYVQVLRDAGAVSDARLGPSARPGWEWVSDVHAGQLQRLARRSERDGTPG